MPPKHLKQQARMVYLQPEVAKHFDEIAKWEGSNFSAVVRRVLTAEYRQNTTSTRRTRTRRSKKG